MPEIPRTKFNPPWTVAVIEAALNDVSSAKGSSESLTAALNAMRAEINSLSGGVHLKGAVDYYVDLPASPSEGDAYTVRYQGTSGTDPLGIEYAWATYQGTPQWIPIGVDSSVFAKATDEAEDRAALVELVDGGAKNRWKITIPSTLPTGFTATVDIDGGLVLNGTAGNSALTFTTSTQFHAGETVVLSGCPSGGSDDSYRLDILRGDNTNYCYGDPVIATNFAETTYQVRVRIAANYTCNNLKFFPMVCTLASWKISQAYQPYRPSWQEMYDRIVALETGGNRALTMQMQQTESTEPEESEAR